MKVKLEKTFSVSAPSNDVWNFMTNVKKVSTCIPGAQYVEDLGENKHSVLLVVKVGPIKSTYKGEVFIRSMDEEKHRKTVINIGSNEIPKPVKKFMNVSSKIMKKLTSLI